MSIRDEIFKVAKPLDMNTYTDILRRADDNDLVSHLVEVVTALETAKTSGLKAHAFGAMRKRNAVMRELNFRLSSRADALSVARKDSTLIDAFVGVVR